MKFNIFKSKKKQTFNLEKFLNDKSPAQVYNSAFTISEFKKYLNELGEDDYKIVFQDKEKKFVDIVLLRKIKINTGVCFKDCINIILG